jgi:hypothetical protein
MAKSFLEKSDFKSISFTRRSHVRLKCSFGRSLPTPPWQGGERNAILTIQMNEKLIFQDNFQNMDQWWSEGGEKVWVQDQELHVKADPEKDEGRRFATVWLKQPLPSNIRLEVDSKVLHSYPDSNNFNFFISYNDPTGKSLYDTRDERVNAEYKLYHPLNGYIVTFLKDPTCPERNEDGTLKARIRFRRCPGFELLTEKFDYQAEQQVNYHFDITKRKGNLILKVDGKQLHEAADSSPLEGGYFGFRTWRTYLTYKNLKIYEILG